jgi:hypothetical protein
MRSTCRLYTWNRNPYHIVSVDFAKVPYVMGEGERSVHIVREHLQLGLPKVYEFNAQIQAGDTLTLPFESRQGIGKFLDPEIWKQVPGPYELCVQFMLSRGSLGIQISRNNVC